MNVENINKTIETIRLEETILFNMESFGDSGRVYGYDTNNVEKSHPCGTAACIAGFALIAQDPSTDLVNIYAGIEPRARDFLGLDSVTAGDLFYPDPIRDWDSDKGEYISGWDATRSQAIAVLEHLRDTGKVDWTVADGK